MNPFSRRSVRASAKRGGLGWDLAGGLVVLAIVVTVIRSLLDK